MPAPPSLIARADRRCAIYTRKSTEQGLGRDFNSLEGQRAICSAYVTSQRHKGWLELANHYDDGGYSGASLNRPQLQQLLGDVERGLVDVVVVYKLDRMTRTLLDFVRLVDFFERYGVVFVSITQNFDTADSMGRLVLNILLTFAQFEREMAADRIRDKVLATKQSGRWAGGPAPYGYDLSRRRLHVNEEEAERVRQIFERYLALGNLTALFREFRDAGMRSKQWRTRAGRLVGGGPLTKSLINHILGNPVYLGEIRHRHETYPGLHAPVVDRAIFEQVQALRATQARKKAWRNKEHVLTDILFDCFGRPMSVSRNFVEGRFAKPSRIYISRQSAWGKRQNLKRLRAKADEIEELVVAAIRTFLSDREKVRSMLLMLGRHDGALDRLSRRGAEAGHRLRQRTSERLGWILKALIVRIELSLERVKIVLRASEIERFLVWDGVGLFKGNSAEWERSRTWLLDVPAGAIKYSQQLVMPIEPRRDCPARHPAPGLKRLICEARECQRLVDEQRDKELHALAAGINYTPWRFARVLRLNYLAPDIITSIIDGTHPPALTRSKLVSANLPMDWSLQRKLLGFPDRAQPGGTL
ncbi:MAG TPA: recombinase family protein [Sphingomicrobium sp.]|nr:recombinase family protein [Sphingomicrobium sp.]